MDAEAFLKRLETARYFEGYSETAIANSVKAIRKRYAAGIKGPYKNAFERFPGLSLVVIEVDQEMIGRNDLKLILKRFGTASLGQFAPQTIQIRRNAEQDQ
jgi:hypothetical protein